MELISTSEAKRHRYNGFSIGNPNGIPVLIQGSCRAVPYLNYFNSLKNNKYLVYYIDPFNFHWNNNDDLTDLEASLLEQEQNNRMLELFPKIKIFIHEHYQSFGMFNTSPKLEKNIFQFGMNPDQKIQIPNFHDCFLLFNDFRLQDWFKKEAQEGIDATGKLHPKTMARVFIEGEQNLDKFIANCDKTDFPEMAEYFQDNFLKTRLFCSFNHISNWLTYWLTYRISNWKSNWLANCFPNRAAI
jgi:hypothetical protein